MRVYIRDGARFFRAQVSPQWAIDHDNGALISCGLTVGEAGFTARMLDGLRRRGRATEVSEEEWKHSGCQSACVLRGARECRW